VPSQPPTLFSSGLRVGPVSLTEPPHGHRLVAAGDRAERACIGLLDDLDGLLGLGSHHYGVTTSTPAALPTMKTPGPVECIHEPNLWPPVVGSITDADASPVEKIWKPFGANA
jgi:hypothetical protein